MYEIETLKRANTYILKLANGIDPLTNTELPSDTIINNIRISRCFFYVSDVLSKVIDNGGEIGRKRYSRKENFSISLEQLEKVEISADPIKISDFCKKIQAEATSKDMKGYLSATSITNWLLHKNIIKVVVNEKGKNTRRLTEPGLEIGISEKLCEGTNGNYILLLYNEHAQRFILDNFFEILDWQKTSVKTGKNTETDEVTEITDDYYNITDMQPPVLLDEE